MTENLVLDGARADAFARELDALRAEVLADLGQRDVDHIRAVVRTAHVSEAIGRLLLAVGIDPVSFVVGTGALAVGKILENMEVGHNVLHGQYDWTKDPKLASATYETDMAFTSVDWRRAHNYEHHTFTNILGKDRDLGYGWLRVAPEQAWEPKHLIQPVVAAVIACTFQWGIALHSMGALEEGGVGRARPLLTKAVWQLFKDYTFYPALALGNAPRVIAGNLLANLARNLWAFAVIYCGHFAEGVRVYDEADTVNESRGQWYARQLNGSANLDGSWLFHVMSGHLSHQIEHHLFPDLPAARYQELAPRVREICARYGQAYTTGRLRTQLGSVVKKLVRFALPNRGGAASAAAREQQGLAEQQREQRGGDRVPELDAA